MGRAFEYRKARKMKRWGNMSKIFTRLGKEITMAAKDGGGDIENNPRLRALVQTAKSENMPRENIERAIKRAVEKDTKDYKEIAYEGYAPFGVAVVVETATDNPTRTVANVRSYFSKFGGTLGTTGSLDFIFDRKCVFKVKHLPTMNIEEIEFDMIDAGLDELFVDDDNVLHIYGAFEQYGQLQKYIEEHQFELISGGFERLPNNLKECTAEQKEQIEKLLERFDEDDDVQNVFHNMA